jgi:dTDP-glucose 4,6-dehydratase
LAHVLAHTGSLWDSVDGKRIFVTGGTGFFGRWALESYVAACDQLRIKSNATFLTRRPDDFRRAAPALANHPAIEMLAGDVRTFDFPSSEFAAVLHLATDADVGLIDRQPREIVDTIVDGTRRVLDFAQACRAERLLHASSGAVYGKQPRDLSHIPEDYRGAPLMNAPRAAYAEAKRLAEVLCVLAHQCQGLGAVNARCFAFVGPLLPTGRGYAIGNFLGDALAGQPICVNSDGSAVRSYLYAADLAIWLWTLLFRGTPGTAYNVGSDTEVSIARLRI